MKKILLTGSSGFIGSEILKKFSKNYIIYFTSRKKKKIKNSKNLFEINYKNYSQLNRKLKKVKVDFIIHCATHYVKNHTYKDIRKLTEANLVFGNIILENLNYLNPKKFINFSTVWEDLVNRKDSFYNLYSVYKKNFRNIIQFYNKYNSIKFYNLFISDTFGKFDKRKKIISTIKANYKKKKSTNIISSNLYLNLINVEDIVLAVDLIINKEVNTGDYKLVNSKYFNVSKIIKKFNRLYDPKIKIIWKTKKVIKNKIYKKNILPNWKPKKSKLKDILDIIKE